MKEYWRTNILSACGSTGIDLLFADEPRRITCLRCLNWYDKNTLGIERDTSMQSKHKPLEDLPGMSTETSFDKFRKDDSTNNGGSTDYYLLPESAKKPEAMVQDLIEARKMNFAMGNIFKATWRDGKGEGNTRLRDLNKIIYFAEREKAMLKEG